MFYMCMNMRHWNSERRCPFESYNCLVSEQFSNGDACRKRRSQERQDRDHANDPPISTGDVLLVPLQMNSAICPYDEDSVRADPGDVSGTPIVLEGQRSHSKP